MSDIYNPPLRGQAPEGLPQRAPGDKLGRIGLLLSLVAPAIVAFMIVFPPG